MRPSRAKFWDRALAGLSVGALAAAGVLWAAAAHADTVTGEGIFMPRGSTAKQFGGAFCPCVTVSSMPTSVRSQAAKLDAAVMASTGPTVVVAFSLSAVAADDMVADWIADPATAPDPSRVWIVTTGSPVNRYGGTQRDRATVTPEVQPYRQLDVVAQYDSVADRPARWGWYSQRELSLSRHLAYDEVDINDPANLVYRAGNTTYMLVPAQELRQLRGLRFLRDIGWVTPERYDEIDTERRAKIEADYDRPAYVPQGPGADWGNGIEPEVLRKEEPHVDQRNRLRADDGNDAVPAVSEDTETGGDVDVDPQPVGETGAGSDQRETRLDESLTWNEPQDDGASSSDTDGGESSVQQDMKSPRSTQTSRQRSETPAGEPKLSEPLAENDESSPKPSGKSSSSASGEPDSPTADADQDTPADSADTEGGDGE